MKKLYIILAVFFSQLSPACSDYLDVVPDNVATIDYAFKDRVRAEQYLFTCYSYMPRVGLPQYQGMFDDLTWTHSNNATIIPFVLGYRILRYGNDVNEPILNTWEGLQGSTNLWQGIRDCNIFIERIESVRDLTDMEKMRWISEVKFLKAFYHFFLLQMYGPIPIVRDNLPIASQPDEVAIYREPVDEVVSYVVELLDEAIEGLPMHVVNNVTELGRITRPIAMAMKAKILVTAASPLFNGNTDYATMIDKRGKQLFNQTYDPTKWSKAAEACKAAIDTCHTAGIALYNLTDPSLNVSAKTRQVLTMSRVIADRWNVERIWGSGQYGNSRTLENYMLPALHPNHAIFCRQAIVPTMKAAELFYSDKGVPISEDLTYDYANRYELVVTGESDRPYLQTNFKTAYLHTHREPRFYGSIGMDGGWWYGLGRYNENDQWPINSKLGQQSGRRGIENYSVTSFFIKKLSNYQSAYNNTTYVDHRWDFPVFRLADLYLLYAEALNESLAEPNSEVYHFVDLIRLRAGLSGVVDSWAEFSRFPSKPTTQAGMREIIQMERSIELAFEGHRFWDVRRWNKAIEYFNQPVRGWNIEGEVDVDFYRVRTIDLPNYTQRDMFWPIRQRELSVNRNLLQNIGW
ncbi:RagB/SusD family nutrient uptake outer membrane protein [Sphingobacterium sp. SGG-5]|uniref:RagB/SusD family nutrient uptake outer membrane protein n=1 Tax=Sphingobacterium sp. SGG-5 TaxID=2710881 RepID=UPI0013ED763C|nr:RagB/SusD family nutrient uptake outer membrane protein [Sphingobacterium sp. SGG-5]NGM63350.1 RagB/SusD family nutrient uptake outer membrane protein [Sphingobacterium sp. SGG-5]